MRGHDHPVVLPTLTWGASGRYRALLLHGLSSAAATWWRVADGLAGAGYQVTAPDLRGHGRAPHTVSYRLGAYAGDVALIGGGWDVVVGHSIGGTVATLVAAQQGFTRRLVLLDPVLMIPEDEVATFVRDQLAELDTAGDPAAVASANPGWHVDDAFLKAQATSQTSTYVVERTVQDNRPWWYLDLLGDVRADIEILGADPAAGALFDPMLGHEAMRHNPRMTMRYVRDVGHSLHREAPRTVLSHLLGDRATPLREHRRAQ